MWLFSLLIGAIIGATVGHGFGALPGAVLGLVFGLAIESKLRDATWELRKRIEKLESEVALLRSSLGQQKASAAAPEPSQAEAPAQAETTADLQKEETPVEPEAASAPSLIPSNVFPSALSPSVFSAIWNWLFTGNILAKVGVVLLFFAVGSGLKLMADYGLMPVQVRLLLASVAAIGLIVFGHAKARDEERRMFGFAAQGGGFGILYLIVYFMLARYQFIGHVPAFFLFAALGVVCIGLAARQDAASLAVLGISGAFLAPVLAAGDEGNHVALFSYFALLNLFILGVNWFKSWRTLNVAGFLFTFVIGMEWAAQSYRPEFYGTSQFFLLLFFLMYTLAPTAYALLKAPGTAGWFEGAVLYGVPLAAAILQRNLLQGDDLALAWWALGASVYYFGLWWLVYRTEDSRMRLMEKSYLGIALVFLTLAVPLAFDVQITVALWALEGCAALWLGVAQNRWLARLGGGLLQIYAGVYFLGHVHRLNCDFPILNACYIGALLIGITGLVSAAQLRKSVSALFSPWMLAWGLAWWLGANWSEIDQYVPSAHHDAAWLLLCVSTGLAAEMLGKRMDWLPLRLAAVVGIAAVFGLPVFAFFKTGHVLHDTMVLAFPLAVTAHYWILHCQENDDAHWLPALRHLAFYWLLTIVAGHELSHIAYQLAPGNTLWPLLGWEIALATALLLAAMGHRRAIWPFSTKSADYLKVGLTPIAALLALWTMHASLSHSGDGSGLPYLPLLSFFDLTLLAGLYGLLYWAKCLHDEDRDSGGAFILAAVTSFIWFSSLAARIAHHWGGVPFILDFMLASPTFQQTLSFVWTALAIALMLIASRRQMRKLWFGGFGLLGVVCAKLLMVDMANRGTVAWTLSLLGIALLTILASYFSPIPPKGDHGEKIVH